MNAADNFYFKKTRMGQQMIADWHIKNNESIRLVRERILGTTEGQQMVKEKLKELRQDLGNGNHQINCLLSEKAVSPDDSDFIYDLFIEEWKKRVKKIYSQIRRFRNYIREDGWQEVLEKKPFDLEVIKQVPIETIMDRPPVRSDGNRDLYYCPLHNETSPSFTVYKNNNSFYCFGCGVGGSNIDLFMRMYNTDFVGACKSLSN